MPMSAFDRANVGEAMRNGSWFTAKLFRLIEAADHQNRERIRRCFPDEVAAFEAWQTGGDHEAHAYANGAYDGPTR